MNLFLALVMKENGRRRQDFSWVLKGPEYSGTPVFLSFTHPIPPLCITWLTPTSRGKFCFHLCGFSWVWTEDMASSSFDEQSFNEFFDLSQLLGLCFQPPQNKHTRQKQPLDLMSLPPRETINHALSPLPSNRDSVSGLSLMSWY